MHGVIEFANPQIARYSVRTDSGGYTVFQLLDQGVVLQVGGVVEGDLESLAVQTYSVRGMGNMNVFAEKSSLKRSAAGSWVKAA